jgi:hypothetical protein
MAGANHQGRRSGPTELDIRTLIGPGNPVAVFVPQPQIRSKSLATAILGGNGGLNIDRLQDWLYGANRAMCVSLERSYFRSKRKTAHGHYG